ncbi:MAG: PQQ-dependent sugar dehydrogenase [Pseudohaliea sp.]
MSTRQRLIALALAAFAMTSHGEERTVARNPIDADPASRLGAIQLPPGFAISLYATGVQGARSMALGEDGTLYVGTRTDSGWNKRDTVYAITNRDGDAVADEVKVLLTGLDVPNGVAVRDGDLYVAEVSRLLRYDDIAEHLDDPPAPVVLNDSFPTDLHHGWKYLRFGPDGRLYVGVGAPCNTCEVDGDYGTIISLAADGSDKQVYARGIRNTVGFDWHPETGELFFTDNGRDMWGNDRPPEELNHAPAPGLHFGFPHRYGADLADSEYPTDRDPSAFTPPAVAFPAHNALLGMHFYTGDQFPASYENQLFIAAHGSWNRNPPDGYRLYRAVIEDGRATGYEIFADGWLTPEHRYWGRPVDVIQAPDGALLVSDDHADAIYRISYHGASAALR